MKPNLVIAVAFFVAALLLLIFSIADPFSWKQLVVAASCASFGILTLVYGGR